MLSRISDTGESETGASAVNPYDELQQEVSRAMANVKVNKQNGKISKGEKKKISKKAAKMNKEAKLLAKQALDAKAAADAAAALAVDGENGESESGSGDESVETDGPPVATMAKPAAASASAKLAAMKRPAGVSVDEVAFAKKPPADFQPDKKMAPVQFK